MRSRKNRIVRATWELIAEHGAQFKLVDVATRASVSRQAVYLHFGDRAALLVALVNHIDESLDLGESLAAVHNAPDGAALLETLHQRDEDAEVWTLDDAAATLFAVAHFDTWRELVDELGWSDDHYVQSMTRLLCRALLRS